MTKTTYPAGHYVPGADTNHFQGLCDECDAHYLAAANLGQVGDMYRTGCASQVQYEAYMWVWSTSSVRFSSAAGAWKAEPTDPAVVKFATSLRAALAARKTAAA